MSENNTENIERIKGTQDRESRALPRNEQDSRPVSELASNGRDTRGRFAVGNVVALKTGIYSRAVADGSLPQQAETLAILAERRAAIAAELGGTENMSTLLDDQVTDYLRLRVIAEWLAANLLTHGPLTTKGRQRAALTAFLQVTDRLHRVASTIGLERRSKSLPDSPAQFLEALAQQGQTS